jgi:cytoplasmic iron level regulating protein YaaA (DUF328/UPF0246 family)
MIVVISPSKTQDFSQTKLNLAYTTPIFNNEIIELVKILSQKSVAELKLLMGISESLAKLNYERYQKFQKQFTLNNAKPSILSFKGDVYEGLDVNNYTKEDFNFAQQHLRILSGLYGLLRPLDLIQPYRLEMGIKLKTPHGNDLYQFWDDKITNEINKLADHNNYLINLASNEYFDAINQDKITAKLITVIFKEKRDNEYKIIGLFAKKARGLMTNFIIKNKITHHEGLQLFNEAGYKFKDKLSNEKQYIFIR